MAKLAVRNEWQTESEAVSRESKHCAEVFSLLYELDPVTKCRYDKELNMLPGCIDKPYVDKYLHLAVQLAISEAQYPDIYNYM